MIDQNLFTHFDEYGGTDVTKYMLIDEDAYITLKSCGVVEDKQKIRTRQIMSKHKLARRLKERKK